MRTPAAGIERCIQIEKNNNSQADCDPYSRISCGVPVWNDDRRRCDFGGYHDSIRVPVVVTESETDSRVKPSSGIMSLQSDLSSESLT